jgi:hypothetical protein
MLGFEHRGEVLAFITDKLMIQTAENLSLDLGAEKQARKKKGQRSVGL